MELTIEQRKNINRFLFSPLMESFDAKQWSQSYPSWANGGRGWHRLEQGGTGTMRAIMWYQHIHKAGSKEWRPSIIIRALLAACEKEAINGPE